MKRFLGAYKGRGDKTPQDKALIKRAIAIVEEFMLNGGSYREVARQFKCGPNYISNMMASGGTVSNMRVVREICEAGRIEYADD